MIKIDYKFLRLVSRQTGETCQKGVTDGDRYIVTGTELEWLAQLKINPKCKQFEGNPQGGGQLYILY